MENKEMFVAALNAAFIAGDPERYGHLSKRPVYYENLESVGFGENLCQDGAGPNGYLGTVSVTGCSCAAIAKVFIESFL